MPSFRLRTKNTMLNNIHPVPNLIELLMWLRQTMKKYIYVNKSVPHRQFGALPKSISLQSLLSES